MSDEKEHTCQYESRELPVEFAYGMWCLETETGNEVAIWFCPYCGKKLK